MYHVLVYAEESLYLSNAFLFHYFTNDPRGALKLIETKLGRTVRYFGIEKLPINVSEGYYFFTSRKPSRWSEPEITLVEKSDLPDGDKRDILKLKERRLTLDIDDRSQEFVIATTMALEILRRHGYISSYEIFKTYRGYHVRANANMRPETKMAVRKIFDDSDRVKFDTAFAEMGFAHLTDILFNEKCWHTGSEWTCYKEEVATIDSVNISDLTLLIDSVERLLSHKMFRNDYEPISFMQPYFKKLYEKLESFKRTLGQLRYYPEIAIPDYGVGVNSTSVKFETPVHPVKALRTILELAEKPSMILDAVFSNPDAVKTALKKVYCDYYGLKACETIAISNIEVHRNYVTIHIPDSHSKFAGLLIGKEGKVVRDVESKLGVKIKIISKTPEDVEMKKKLCELKRKLV